MAALNFHSQRQVLENPHDEREKRCTSRVMLEYFHIFVICTKCPVLSFVFSIEEKSNEWISSKFYPSCYRLMLHIVIIMVYMFAYCPAELYQDNNVEHGFLLCCVFGAAYNDKACNKRKVFLT